MNDPNAISDPAMDDGIHTKIEDAIKARIELADVLLREANSLMRCDPERFGPQVDIARRKEQFP